MARLITTIGAAAAAAGAVFLFAVPANAATTYTVTAGSAPSGTKVNVTGATTGPSPQVKFSDTTAGQNLTCASGTAKGSVTTGNARKAAGIAKITGSSLNLKNCTGPGGLPLFTKGSGTWPLNATSYANGKTNGTLTSISAHVATSDGTTCAFDVTGTVNGSFTNNSQVLAIVSSGSTLKLSNVQGCFGLLNNGDHATFQAKFKLTPTNAAYKPIKIVQN
jgi:hypothetical protein